MIHIAYLEALPASAASEPHRATVHLVTALTDIERTATHGFEKIRKKLAAHRMPLLGAFTWYAAIIAVRQLKLGHGRAAGGIISSLDTRSRRMLDLMFKSFALKVTIEELEREPERHSLLKRTYERGIIDGVASRDIVAALSLDISQIADLHVRRQIELLMQSVYAGDHHAVARYASHITVPGARATIRELLARHGLTIWDPVKGGPSTLVSNLE